MNPINSLTLKGFLDRIERCKSTKNGFMDLYGLYITLFKLYISRSKNYCKKVQRLFAGLVFVSVMPPRARLPSACLTLVKVCKGAFIQ